MKLTNYMRDAFVSAAMNDVPSVDYEQQARDLVEKALDATFAKIVPGVTRATLGAQGWMSRCGVKTPGVLGNIFTYAPGFRCIEEDDAKTWAKLTELADKQRAQSEQHTDLRNKLHAVAYSVTTRKALVAALPEFEKYLPADEAKAVRSLPVVANVVTDFVKAGWPKK